MRFINDVYKKDDLPREILAYKTELMLRLEELNCGAFCFSYNSDVIESRIDRTVLDVKTNIRKLIASKMENYYYDILFHVTDTADEYEFIRSVLPRYGILV